MSPKLQLPTPFDPIPPLGCPAQEYFTNNVNQTIDTSIKYVRSYVHAYLMDNIEAARQKIAGYGERYGEIMRAALRTKSQSELKLSFLVRVS